MKILKESSSYDIAEEQLMTFYNALTELSNNVYDTLMAHSEEVERACNYCDESFGQTTELINPITLNGLDYESVYQFLAELERQIDSKKDDIDSLLSDLEDYDEE